MAFAQSAINGMLVHMPDRMVSAGLPQVFKTVQNGHLMKRDPVTGDVLVQLRVDSEPVPAGEAIKQLRAAPAETRIAAKQEEAASRKGRSKKVAPEPVKVDVPEYQPPAEEFSYSDDSAPPAENPFGNLWQGET